MNTPLADLVLQTASWTTPQLTAWGDAGEVVARPGGPAHYFVIWDLAHLVLVSRRNFLHSHVGIVVFIHLGSFGAAGGEFRHGGERGRGRGI